MPPASSATKRVQGKQRPRSVPHKGPLITAVLFTIAFYLCLVGLFAAIFAFFILRNVPAAGVVIGFIVISSILWLLSYFKRREARCPLCQGTPFLDSRAHYHVNAKRYFPLNYGTSNIINALVVQRYRCHYCGTRFDLLKRPDKQIRRR